MGQWPLTPWGWGAVDIQAKGLAKSLQRLSGKTGI